MGFPSKSHPHSSQSPRNLRSPRGPYSPLPPKNRKQNKSKSGNLRSARDSAQCPYSTGGSQRANKLQNLSVDILVAPHNRSLLDPVSSMHQLNQASDISVPPTSLISRARAEPVTQTGNPCAIAGLKSSKCVRFLILKFPDNA